MLVAFLSPLAFHLQLMNFASHLPFLVLPFCPCLCDILIFLTPKLRLCQVCSLFEFVLFAQLANFIKERRGEPQKSFIFPPFPETKNSLFNNWFLSHFMELPLIAHHNFHIFEEQPEKEIFSFILSLLIPTQQSQKQSGRLRFHFSMGDTDPKDIVDEFKDLPRLIDDEDGNDLVDGCTFHSSFSSLSFFMSWSLRIQMLDRMLFLVPSCDREDRQLWKKNKWKRKKQENSP